MVGGNLLVIKNGRTGNSCLLSTEGSGRTKNLAQQFEDTDYLMGHIIWYVMTMWSKDGKL